MIGIVTTQEGLSCAKEMKEKGHIDSFEYYEGSDMNEILKIMKNETIMFFDKYIQEKTVKKTSEMMKFNDYILVHRDDGYLFPFAMIVVPNMYYDGKLMTAKGPYLRIFRGTVLPPTYSK